MKFDLFCPVHCPPHLLWACAPPTEGYHWTFILYLFFVLFYFVLFLFLFCFVFVLFCFVFKSAVCLHLVSYLFTFILAILYLSIELYIDNFAHHILSCYMMSPTLMSSGDFFHCSVSLMALNTVVDVVYAEVSSCLLWITKALWGFTLVTLSP